ncbi:MAG TPA: TMEM175 family protein [Candidatus Limnocylindrales bacterium]
MTRGGSAGSGGRWAATTVLERLVFFSDAVFAIALTLLAIDLRLPERVGSFTDATFLAALGDLAPTLVAFLLGFGVVAAFWLGHVRTFRVIVRSNSRLVELNLVFLFFVALQPFPTSIIARVGNLASAAVLYAGLASPLVTRTLARHVTYRALVVPLIFAASIPIALANPYAAEACWFLAFPGQALVSWRFGIHARLERSMATPTDDESPDWREAPADAGPVVSDAPGETRR